MGLIPVVAWVQDWTNFPAHRWSFILQYLHTPWIILESQLNIWWTNGKLVDDFFRQSVFRRNDELILKATYQF